MAHEINFPRNIDNLLASAGDDGLMVIAGWHMPIPRADALGYVSETKYNTNPNVGFFHHDGKVTLSHGAGKISLSEQEAVAIVGLIKSAYAA